MLTDQLDIKKVLGIEDEDPETALKMQRECFAAVYKFFEEDAVETWDWFLGKNFLIGGLRPLDMIAFGKTEKLHRFIKTSIEENREC